MNRTCGKDSPTKWLMKISEPFTCQTGIKGYSFKNEWIEITPDGTLTIFASEEEGKEYAWDGCTPKLCVFGRVIGTPDGRIGADGRPITWKASLVHDALYQFIQYHKIPRKQIDDLFLANLREADFQAAWLYWAAVRTFGGIFIAVTR